MTLRLPRSVALPLLAHGALFFMVISGILPRAVVLPWTFLVLGWLLIAPLKDAVVFFIAAIPLFLAIPLTPSFDNFNMWRIAALVLFLRWLVTTQSLQNLWQELRAFLARPRNYPTTLLFSVLGITALLSLLHAADLTAGLRRIIFFFNAGMVPFVLFSLIRKETRTREQALAAIAWSTMLVIIVGFLQLLSTYFIDVYAFMRIWGEGVQLRQFGHVWSDIAVTVGNTWLAYYGPQLSLRVFSLFPDSHSFPIYVLLGLGGIVAVALQSIVSRLTEGVHSFRTLLKTRARWSVVWIPLGFLIAILSGTRGIWAASAGLPLLILLGIWQMRRGNVPRERKLLWRYFAVLITTFYLLFAIAWPIFISPQFLLSKGDWGLLGNRVRSIIDFGETSNEQRIVIWKATIHSIQENPLIGVGIGNYPTVLSQDVILAKAGSSAHNIWLHVAAEMGLIALLAWIAFWLLLLRWAWQIFTESGNWQWAAFGGWMLLAIPWVAAYLLTDAALFDERALLLFGVIVALLRSHRS